MTRNPVDTVQLVSPQLPVVLESAPELLDRAEQVLVGGDLMAPRHAALLLSRHDPDRFRFVHVYGPTECTLFATTEHVTHVDVDRPSVPIGRPLPNTRVYVLSPGLVPQPTGVPGEVAIGGAGVARGYLGRAADTARRFRPDPYSPPGSRLYLTGDLGRFLPDGRLEFLGRRQTGSISEASGSRPARSRPRWPPIRPWPRPWSRYARTCPAGGDWPVTSYRRIRRRRRPPRPCANSLRTTLPAHMVPAGFMVLPRLPLTGNGKVDRAGLPPVRLPVAAADRADRTPLEQRVAELWAEALEGGRGAGRRGLLRHRRQLAADHQTSSTWSRPPGPAG